MSGRPLALPGPHGRWPRIVRAVWVMTVRPLVIVLGELLRRVLDVCLALLFIALLTPVLVVRGGLSAWRRGGMLSRTRQLGQFRRPFERLAFADDGLGRGLPALLNVLRGDLSFVGPRPLTAREAREVESRYWVRWDVRPGLVSLYSVRRGARITHGTEGDLDRELVYRETTVGDLGLLARWAPASLLGGRADADTPDTLMFFGVPVANGTMDEAVDWITERADAGTHTTVAFVNPDCFNQAYTNDAYRQALQRTTRVLPDGIGLNLGCRFQGTSLRANVNGTDLFPRLCERLSYGRHSVYLLGGRDGVAAKAAENIQQRYPGLRVAGTHHGFLTPDTEPRVIETINQCGASLLLVGFGVPRQELWLARHADALTPAVLMGVGGLFDYYSGRIPRAPLWMRELGLEWVWRLMQEPGRLWRRYLIGNPLFLLRVWRAVHGKGPS